MATRFFRHRDRDYEAWRASHLNNGFIVNIDESASGGNRIHRASCRTLQIPIDKGQDLTGPYPKHCSTDQAQLRRETGNPRSCAICAP